MDINLPNWKRKKPRPSAPKAGVPAKLRDLWPPFTHSLRPCRPGQPGPNLRQPGPFPAPPGSDFGLSQPELGEPISIDKVAKLIGCFPWTVRHTLIPRGLPHFWFKASGRLIFYKRQVIRWIERQLLRRKVNCESV